MAGRKRKEAKVIIPSRLATVEQLNLGDILLVDKYGSKFHLNRLRYRGVPSVDNVNGNNINNSVPLVYAKRDNVIRELYRLIPKQDGLSDITAQAYLSSGITSYFKYIDIFEEHSTPFSIKSMHNCIIHFNALALKRITPSKASSIKSALNYFLCQMGREEDARRLPKIAIGPRQTTSLIAYDIETELKPVSKILIKGHKDFIANLQNNTVPEIHPFYDETLLIKMSEEEKWTEREFIYKKNLFKTTMIPTGSTVYQSQLDVTKGGLRYVVLFNHASRCALFLFYMLTGMNTTVLISMKRSGVMFKDVGAGKFVFSSIKGRAGYKEVDNALGFSKFTKELIEGWLSASQVIFSFMGIDNIKDMPLMPFINSRSQVVDFKNGSMATTSINKLLGHLLPFRVTASRFRKTKADTLMRVTQDMYLVSQGLNNTVEMVQRSYSSGVKSDHDRNLSAAMEAQAAISKGVTINQAVESAKVLHSDILSEYDYKERLSRNEIPVNTLTPSGIRCSGDEGAIGNVERKVKNLAISLERDESRCTSFLSCFDCSNHVLVASEHDIWLMLSFYEQISEIRDIPNYNSTPKSKLDNIDAVLSRTLLRLKEKAPLEYSRAEIKLESQGAHPLYSNLRGIADTLETFNV